ncbi:DoxX family protein [bacterium]|nr:DoxX family protein [bacterium]
MFLRISLLLLRLQVGYLFWTSGWQKWSAEPSFTDGVSLGHFLKKCLLEHEDGSVSAAMIQNYFIPHAELLAKLVVAGELAVGAALLAGCATRPACVIGIAMNVCFMLAQGGGFLTFDNNAFFILIQLALMAGAAGRFIGIDAVLTKKCPNKYLW